MASPGASPIALPVASPAATPAPVATPDVIGGLRVIRGEAHDYPGEPVESGELRMMVSGSDHNLDFSPAALRQDFQIMCSYLDPLVWIDDVTMEPRPWLAESWEWSDNNRTLTMTLREGVSWHDGEPLDANDVVFSFYVYRDDLDSAVRNIFATMEAAEAVDSRTVRVSLTTADGNWLFNAASQLIFQESQYSDYWTQRPVGQRTLSGFPWETTDPVGTGPWIVGRRRRSGIDFMRNDDYWADPPHFESLRVTWSSEPEAPLNAWLAGEVDIAGPVNPGDLATLSNTSGQLYVSSGAHVMFAAFNFDNPHRTPATLLADPRIRQALNLAVDRERYAESIFLGLVNYDAAGTIAQPWAHDPSITNPPRDLITARDLLGEAGYLDLNGDGYVEDIVGTPLALSVIVRADSEPFLIDILSNLVADFADAGISLTVRVLPPAEFTATWVTSREYDLIAYSYRLYPGFTDYDLYGSNWDIRINPQGWNPGGYDNEAADQAIRRVLRSIDINQQRNHLFDLQQAVNDDLFGLWFGFPDDLVLVRDGIAGFQPNKYQPTWNTRLLWEAEDDIQATPVAVASSSG